MSIESIIGIVAGIFGIVTGCAWLHGVMKQHAKQKTAYSLLKQIADKNSTDVQRRKILNKLNKNKFVNGRIKESYINKFVLSGKGIEKLLLEICVENEIEPTEDLCKELIDTKGQSLRKQYSEIRATPITKQGAEEIPNTKAEEVAFKERIPVKIGATADPFPIIEKTERITYNCLKVFQKYDYPVQISTKNPEIFLSYAEDFNGANIALNVSCSFCDDDIAR